MEKISEESLKKIKVGLYLILNSRKRIVDCMQVSKGKIAPIVIIGWDIPFYESELVEKYPNHYFVSTKEVQIPKYNSNGY